MLTTWSLKFEITIFFRRHQGNFHKFTNCKYETKPQKIPVWDKIRQVLGPHDYKGSNQCEPKENRITVAVTITTNCKKSSSTKWNASSIGTISGYITRKHVDVTSQFLTQTFSYLFVQIYQSRITLCGNKLRMYVYTVEP